MLLGFSVCLCVSANAFDFGGANDITAVSARKSKDYMRTRLTNGSFAPESYVFAEGGSWKGTMIDATIDKLNFLEIAHTIASPLAGQNYIPSKDPKTTKLLVMVYWGTTRAPENASESNGYVNLQLANGTLGIAQTSMNSARASGNSQSIRSAGIGMDQANNELTSALILAKIENNQRDQLDLQNAALLGYDSAGLIATEYGRYLSHTALGLEQRDLVTEIEENRYFVVLMAYDFQLLWKEKKHKLLWETRFSLRQRHHQFNKDLPGMAQYASRYFGQDSDGLVRKPVPLGHVEVGEPKSLGNVPEK